MFVLPTSHKPLYGYINDEAIYLHQKGPDTVSKKISFFGHMVNLGVVYFCKHCSIVMRYLK